MLENKIYQENQAIKLLLQSGIHYKNVILIHQEICVSGLGTCHLLIG
jgi:hypothetical protein